MKSYLIGCDLNRPGRNYPELMAAFDQFPLRWHHLDCVWVVKVDWTVRQVRDHLKPHIDPTDELLVVELTGEAAWCGFNDDAIVWLSEHL
jgi:hypothetical protein